eukprot:scaffold25_cov342-Pavlova_lutheri.AAC.62
MEVLHAAGDADGDFMCVPYGQPVVHSVSDALESFQQGSSFAIFDHGCCRQDFSAHPIELHDVGVRQTRQHGDFHVELLLGFGGELLRGDPFQGHLPSSPEGHVDHGHGSCTNPAPTMYGVFHLQVFQVDLFSFLVQFHPVRHLLGGEHAVLRVSHLLEHAQGFHVRCAVRVFHRRPVPGVPGVGIRASPQQHVHDLCLSFGGRQVQQRPSIVIESMHEILPPFQQRFESDPIVVPTRPEGFGQLLVRRPCVFFVPRVVLYVFQDPWAIHPRSNGRASAAFAPGVVAVMPDPCASVDTSLFSTSFGDVQRTRPRVQTREESRWERGGRRPIKNPFSSNKKSNTKAHRDTHENWLW